MIEELRVIGGRSGVFAFETLSWLQNFFTLALMNLHKEMPSTTNEKVAQATAMSDLLQYIQLTGAAMQWLYMTDGKVQADVNHGMDELWESLADASQGLYEFGRAVIDGRYRYDFMKKMLQGIQSHIESTHIYVGKSTTELIESSDRYDESDRNLLYYSKLFPGLVTKFFDDGISGYDQATGRPLNTFQAVQSIFSGVSAYTGAISFMVSAPYMAASTLNFVSRTMPGLYQQAANGAGRFGLLIQDKWNSVPRPEFNPGGVLVTPDGRLQVQMPSVIWNRASRPDGDAGQPGSPPNSGMPQGATPGPSNNQNGLPEGTKGAPGGGWKPPSSGKKGDPVPLPDGTTWNPDMSNVPDSWGDWKPNKKFKGDNPKPGIRFVDPNNPGNTIRIDKGDPNALLPSQRVDHVVINVSYTTIGPDGLPIAAPKPSKTAQAHIPLSDWVNWASWAKP